MKLLRVCSLILILSLTFQVDGLKVLAVLPILTKSHWIIGHEIVKSLVDAGHKATVLSPYPLKERIPNYEEVDISGPMMSLHDCKCCVVFLESNDAQNCRFQLNQSIPLRSPNCHRLEELFSCNI